MFDGDEKQQCQLCCTICAVVSFIVFLCLCFDAVTPTYYGILCNSISKTCDFDEVYPEGRHWVWPTNYFIEFPGSLQTVEFKDDSIQGETCLASRTSDGLDIYIDVTFQYQLIYDSLPDLYALSAMDYEATFIRIARDTLMMTAGDYEGTAYWLEREEIGIIFKEALDIDLQEAFCHCIFLQILDIILPEDYEDAIVATQVEKQEKIIKEYEQEAELIEEEILLQGSITDATILVIESTAEAEAVYIVESANAYATLVSLDAEAEAYSLTKDKIELEDSELNDYIYYITLMKKEEKELLVGMQTVVADARHV